MRKSTVLALSLWAVPAIDGCKRQLNEPIRSNDPALESPVGNITTSRQVPPAISEAPPLHHNEPPSAQRAAPAASGEQAIHESESPRRSPAPAAGARTDGEAEAELRGLTGERLRGRAELKERKGGVEIALEVENASPGTRLVALDDTGSCAEVSPRDASRAASAKPGQHRAEEPNPELGALVIDRNGGGKLRINVPDANLQREQQGSLLGKTLVIYPPERITTKRGQTGAVIACAQILAK